MKLGENMEWEYQVIYIGWDKKLKNFVVQFTDSTSIIGLEEILNRYGSSRWELVNLVEASRVSYPYENEIIAYRAIFKRPRRNTSDLDLNSDT